MGGVFYAPPKMGGVNNAIPNMGGVNNAIPNFLLLFIVHQSACFKVAMIFL